MRKKHNFLLYIGVFAKLTRFHLAYFKLRNLKVNGNGLSVACSLNMNFDTFVL